MTDNETLQLAEDFQDFLFKVVRNYSSVSYSELAGTIFGQMVVLAQHSDNENIVLYLLPHMKQSIMDSMGDKPLH